jgi:hypothetical protein
MSHLQAFLPVQAVNPFVINLPPFPSQQDMNALIAVPHPGRRHFPDALPQNRLLHFTGFVVVGRTACPENRRGSANADAMPNPQVIDQLPPPGRP